MRLLCGCLVAVTLAVAAPAQAPAPEWDLARARVVLEQTAELRLAPDLEVGHYLGVDRTADGRDVDAALQGAADLLEEMKADLVSLFAAPALQARGYYDAAAVRALYASGIRRTLQNNRPRRDQPYQTMQLMQQNYFLEHGLLGWDDKAQALAIHYERYPEVVAALLQQVLAVQHAGDRAAAEAFVARWTAWDARHEALAAKLRAKGGPRFRLVRYGPLGE